jgi:hypothetical protein
VRICDGFGNQADILLNSSLSGNAPICPNGTATFTAQPASPASTLDDCTINWSSSDGNMNPTTGGPTSELSAVGNSGTVTVTADLNGSTASGSIMVTAVDSVDPGTDKLCAGESTAVTASPDPAGASFPQGSPTWSVNKGSVSPTYGDKVTYTADQSYTGAITITATCGSSSSKSATITVVGVGSVAPNSDTLCAGESTDITATADPSGQDFPSVADPEWTVTPSSAGTLSPDIGDTVTFTSDAGFGGTATVKASCGSSSKTTGITVVRVASITPDCANVGIGQTISLSANVTPSGRVVDWTFVGTSPPGCSLAPTSDLTADFTAGNVDGTVTVKACDSAVPTCCKTLSLTVVGACAANSTITPLVPDVIPGGSCHGYPAATEIPPYPAAIDAKITACYDSSQDEWRIRVVSVQPKVYQNVCLAKPDVPSAYDPIVTSATYCDIIASLTPLSCGWYPCFSDYMARDCIMAHEFVHKSEWGQAFNQVWPNAETAIENLTVPFDCGNVDTPDKAVAEAQADIDAILSSARNAAMANWPDESSSGATAAGNACFQGRISDMIHRAQSQGWPSCP